MSFKLGALKRITTIMSKKNWFLIGIVVVLAGIYIVFFTEWFKPQTVKIFHTSRKVAAPRRGSYAEAMPGLIFGLSRSLTLTDVKVISLNDPPAGQKSVPLWHLVANSNAVPVKSFYYGQYIRGLKPAIPGSRPEPLATNIPYRLIIEAGKVRGEHDFELK